MDSEVKGSKSKKTQGVCSGCRRLLSGALKSLIRATLVWGPRTTGQFDVAFRPPYFLAWSRCVTLLSFLYLNSDCFNHGFSFIPYHCLWCLISQDTNSLFRCKATKVYVLVVSSPEKLSSQVETSWLTRSFWVSLCVLGILL